MKEGLFGLVSHLSEYADGNDRKSEGSAQISTLLSADCKDGCNAQSKMIMECKV